MRQITPENAYTLEPTKSEWADDAVRTLCGNLSLRKTNSHATRQGTLSHSRLSSLSPLLTDPGLTCGIGVRKLISSLRKIRKAKQNKKRRRGMNRRTFPQTPRTGEKGLHVTGGIKEKRDIKV